MMDETIKLVSNVGFPIFVAVFLLLRLEPAIQRLSTAVERLTLHVADCKEKDNG